MKLHRFIGAYNLTKQNQIIEDNSLSQQLKKVLRMKVGESIILCNGEGQEVIAKIQNYLPHGVEVELEKEIKEIPEPNVQVSLYISILKKDSFDWMLQKVTEVGVTNIIPIQTARTVKLNINQERLEKVLKEASEQSGRGSVPKLMPIMTFNDALNDSQKCEAQYIGHTSSQTQSLKTVINKEQKSIAIFIGPEGGFEEKEVKQAVEQGIKPVSLGTRILRAETAAIVACDRIISLYE